MFPCRNPQGLLRSVQRLDRCDRHQILHGAGEVPIERDQRVGVQLGQGDVLGVKGVRPPEQAGGFPCDVLEDAVPQQPDPQPAHVVELSLRILPGHLAAAYCLVEKRQHLGAQQRRGQELMVAANHGLIVSQANGDVRADHVPAHGRITYLLMEDQFPLDAAPRERLPRLRRCRARSWVRSPDTGVPRPRHEPLNRT